MDSVWPSNTQKCGHKKHLKAQKKFRLEGLASDENASINPTLGYDIATSFMGDTSRGLTRSVAVLGGSFIANQTTSEDCVRDHLPKPAVLFSGKNDESFCLVGEPQLWVHSSLPYNDNAFGSSCALNPNSAWCHQEGWAGYNLPFDKNLSVPGTLETGMNQFLFGAQIERFDNIANDTNSNSKSGWLLVGGCKDLLQGALRGPR